jgi:hypothetical protein
MAIPTSVYASTCTNDSLVLPPTGGQFTEDGSFIGQYVPGKLNPPVSPQPIHHQAGTSGAATYV